MIVCFDLDDTLYDESSFVRSGFRAVAQHLEQAHGVAQGGAYRRALDILRREGRGAVFDQLLAHYGLAGKTRVRQCVAVYRSHSPSVQLSAAARRCLDRFEGPLYLVTDGNRNVQLSKIRALNLEQRFTRCLATHAFGVAAAKPSPHCFLRICEWEKAPMRELVYIGDNPSKDFVGIKPLGALTVRVLTGHHRQEQTSSRYAAHHTAASLDEITPARLQQWSDRR